MYCSLDKIDLSATIEGRQVAIQTDHRSTAEIEAEPELSALFAMARVINARSHLEDETPDAAVRYVVAGTPPAVLLEALTAVGATLERLERESSSHRETVTLGVASEEAASAIADRSFRELALRAAARVGSRDLAIALRMLEDQTYAAPPARHNEPEYWQRVLELAALTGELLRAKYPGVGRWVQTDRALVPFGFQLSATDTAGSTVMFPTNRAQRVVEDGSDESLFKLLMAAEETMARPPDATTGRLMPSLRDRRNVELDEIVWQPVLSDDAPPDLPIIVCGIDGESTFGMIRREALDKPPAAAMEEALANVADEEVDSEVMNVGELDLLVVSGGFYAAEKLLDREFMLELHEELDAEVLAAAVPTRGLLLVTTAELEPAQIARFVALAQLRHDEGGGRAISPAVLLVKGGRVAGFVRDVTAETRGDRPDTDTVRADTAPGSPRKPNLLRRLLGRK
jgi:hypothetical protein